MLQHQYMPQYAPQYVPQYVLNNGIYCAGHYAPQYTLNNGTHSNNEVLNNGTHSDEEVYYDPYDKNNNLHILYPNRGTVLLEDLDELFSGFISIGNILADKGIYKILEVGSGNCVTTTHIEKMLQLVDNKFKIIATDIAESVKNYTKREVIIKDAVNAVNELAENVLMIISPPPGHTMDIDSIISFRNKKSDKEKYVIYMGIMGVTDGSQKTMDEIRNNWRIVHYTKGVRDLFLLKLKEINSPKL